MSAFTLSNTATARAVFVAKYVRHRRGIYDVASARWSHRIERIVGRDRSIGGLDGGSIDESLLKKSRGSSKLRGLSLPAFDGYDDRTTEPTTGPTTTTRRAHYESDATDGNNLKRVSRFFAHSRPKTTRRNATIVRAEGEAAAVREIRSIRAPLGWISSFEFPNRPRTARRRAREFLTRLNEMKFVPRD